MDIYYDHYNSNFSHYVKLQARFWYHPSAPSSLVYTTANLEDPHYSLNLYVKLMTYELHIIYTVKY